MKKLERKRQNDRRTKERQRKKYQKDKMTETDRHGRKIVTLKQKMTSSNISFID